MLLWSRDAWILERIDDNERIGGAAQPYSGGVGNVYVCGGEDFKSPKLLIFKTTATPYPPNGIIPFQGISFYALPLCYLFTSAEAAYLTFRQIYVK